MEKFQEGLNKLAGENFLLYDSFEDHEDYENDEADESDGDETRIIIFSTRSNLQRLSRSKEWHVDGTFKTSPTIFFQLFTILGSETQVIDDDEQTIALPYVYSLLPNKKESSYTKVLKIVMKKNQEFFGMNQIS